MLKEASNIYPKEITTFRGSLELQFLANSGVLLIAFVTTCIWYGVVAQSFKVGSHFVDEI